MSMTRLRSDGRFEVTDMREADILYGCKKDDWCILTNYHDGECNEDREIWPGLNEEYA